MGRRRVIKSLDDKVAKRVHRIRNRPNNFIRERIPRVPGRNIGQGIATGLVESGVALILKEVIGIPFGAEAEVVDVEANPEGDGHIYTVNVNAPLENMAEARAFLESSTGFTSILTDTLDVQSTEVIAYRTLRDTYQIEVLIKG